jgi:hypothetical protein
LARLNFAEDFLSRAQDRLKRDPMQTMLPIAPFSRFLAQKVRDLARQNQIPTPTPLQTPLFLRFKFAHEYRVSRIESNV